MEFLSAINLLMSTEQLFSEAVREKQTFHVLKLMPKQIHKINEIPVVKCWNLLRRLLNLRSVSFCRGLNNCDALTICHKVFGHVEGDFDGERAGVLRGVDHGDHARADGDQRQGDLAQRTVSVAWGWRKRGRSRGQRSNRGLFIIFLLAGQRESNPQS